MDRGYNGPEVLAYLLAQKVLAPRKWFLLRGNHEIRSVNGDENVYGLGSYLTQCRIRFGDMLGKQIWETCNKCFDFLPAAAVIDEQLFCAHGGIPRKLTPGGEDTRLDDIRSLPQPFDPCQEIEKGDIKSEIARAILMDMLWGDPASESQSKKLNNEGYLVRGALDDPMNPDTPRHMVYGVQYLDEFFHKHKLNRLLRGHQAVATGCGVSMGTRVLTVFSDSKDHFDHEVTQCGIILVEDEISVITGVPQSNIAKTEATPLPKMEGAASAEAAQPPSQKTVMKKPNCYNERQLQKRVVKSDDDSKTNSDLNKIK